MEKEEKPNGERTIRVKLELPFELRVFVWTIWNIFLGFILGFAVHHLMVVMYRLR